MRESWGITSSELDNYGGLEAINNITFVRLPIIGSL